MRIKHGLLVTTLFSLAFGGCLGKNIAPPVSIVSAIHQEPFMRCEPQIGKDGRQYLTLNAADGVEPTLSVTCQNDAQAFRCDEGLIPQVIFAGSDVAVYTGTEPAKDGSWDIVVRGANDFPLYSRCAAHSTTNDITRPAKSARF